MSEVQPHTASQRPNAAYPSLPRTAPLVQPPARHLGLRLTLAGLAAFLAITAFAGAFFVIPTLPSEYLLRGPFTDYMVPALALGIIVGGSALLAGIMVLVRPAIGAMIAFLSGVAIIIFELVEIAVIGLTAVDQPAQPAAWLQVFYIALGVVIMALGVTLWRRAQQRVLRPMALT